MTLTKIKNKTLLAVVISILTAIKIGSAYGTSGNQQTYLLKGLQMAHPGLWPTDWWLNDTPQYHVFFSYIVYAFEMMGIAAPAFFMLNIIVIIATYFYIWKIIDFLWPKRSMVIFSITILISVGIRNSFSFGYSFIHVGGFQPASLPTFGIILGMYFYLKGQFLKSGLILGFLGLFHANFAILSMPMFGLAHLLLGKKNLFSRLGKQLLPQIILFLPLLPSIIKTVQFDIPPIIVEQAYDIIKIRSPFHYDFSFLFHKLPPYLIVFFMGAVSLFRLKQNTREVQLFSSLFFALQIMIIGAVIEAIFINSLFMTRLFVWRLSPFLEILSYALIAGEAFKLGLNITTKNKLSARLFPEKIAQNIIVFLSISLMISITIITFNKNKFWIFSDKLNGLYTFIRKNTPVDAVFLISPNDERFRQFSERSVLVSGTEVPLSPTQTLEWFHRIESITGGNKITIWDNDTLNKKYHNLTFKDLTRIRKAYPFDYVLFARKNLKDESQLNLSMKVIYKDKTNILYKISG